MKMKKVILALGMVPTLNWAATAPDYPTGVISGAQIMQNVQIPQQKSLQQNVKPVLKNEDALSAEVDASPQADFVLKQVAITNAPAGTGNLLAAIYTPNLNQPMDFNGLKSLASKMQTALRNQGYVLAQVIIPPQTINKYSGAVKFQVIEGDLAKVYFSGDAPNGAKEQLERYAALLENKTPVTLADIEEVLTLMDQLPGIDAHGVLTPSKTPGAADLDVIITQHPMNAYVAYNNRGTSYIGQSQMQAGFSLNDILAADSLAFNYATALPQPDQLNYMNASYTIVPFASGTRLTPSVTYVDTRPGQELSLFNMVGQSVRYAFDVNQPLISSRLQNLSLLAGAYYLSSNNNLLNFETYNDQISALDLGLNYNGLFLQGWNSATLTATQAVPAFGTERNEPNPSRLGGEAVFTKVNLDVSHTHYLTERFSFVLASSMQYAFNPLLVPEQMGYGGAVFGQAYEPSEIIGDQGLMGSFTVRYDVPQFMPKVTLLQPFAFYDVGKVWSMAAGGIPASSVSGASTGFGLNTQITKTWQATLTFAYPLTLVPQETGNHSWRTFFSIVGMF